MRCFLKLLSALLFCAVVIKENNSTASEWIVDADGNWNLVSNWLGPVPDGTGAIALFGTAITGNRNVIITDPTDNNVTVGQLEFDGHFGYSLSEASGQSFTLSGSPAASIMLLGMNGNAQEKISDSISLASNLTLENDSGGALVFNQAQISGSNITITKTGNGTVLFLDSDTHNLTGTTTWLLNGGTVVDASAGTNQLSASANLVFNGGTFVAENNVTGISSIFIGSGGGTISVFDSSASQFGITAISTPNELTGNGRLIKQGLGTLGISGAQSGFTGSVEVRGGEINASDSSQPLANAAGFIVDGVSGIFAGQLLLSSTNLTNVPISVGSGGVLVAPSGVSVGLASLTRGGNLVLAPGAVVAQTTSGGNASIQGLGATQDLYFGIGTSQNIAALTIGAGTPWTGLSGIEESNVTLN